MAAVELPRDTPVLAVFFVPRLALVPRPTLVLAMFLVRGQARARLQA